MGRTIQRSDNSFLKAVLKLIPSEIVAVYIFLQGVLPEQFYPYLAVSVALVIITPLYLRFATGVKAAGQLAVSTVSTAVWIYAMGGPFRFLAPPWYEPWYGSAVLALWTLIPPMFLYRGEAPEEAP